MPYILLGKFLIKKGEFSYFCQLECAKWNLYKEKVPP